MRSGLAALVHQDVVRLQVAVDDEVGVRVLDRVADLLEEIDPLGKADARGVLVDVEVERHHAELRLPGRVIEDPAAQVVLREEREVARERGQRRHRERG